MKIYKKTFLPDFIIYFGETYTLNPALSTAMILNNTPLRSISHELKKEGRKMVVVYCLPKRLKGKTDLHGNIYKPTTHIYTTKQTLHK